MRAWQLQNTGKQNLRLIDVPRPAPGPGEVLIRAQAVSLNYRDKAIVDGTYPVPVTFPVIPASDLAGEVIAVGDQVQRLQPGDRVISVFKPLWIDGTPGEAASHQTLGSPLPGVLADYVVLPESGALKFPDYLSPAEASTLPIAGVTAWVALFSHGQLRSGQTVLVQGSGGVALAALQLALAHGARVIALTRSDSKGLRLKELGASAIVNTSKTPNWDHEVRRLTEGKGVDYVIEVLGGDQVQRSISASGWGGHIALIGFMDQQNATISVPSVLGSTIRLQGVYVGSQKDEKDLLSFIAAHRIVPVIDSTYDFERVPDAFDHLDRGPFGKVVVTIS